MDKLREFKTFLEEMSEEMKERNQRNLISAHYGVKEPEFKRMIGEILGDIMAFDSRSEVLDKHFSKLDNIGRLKVHGYYIALDMTKKARIEQ